ncbi:MAG: hypothetical protein ACJ8DH_11930, partial [Microvirga sp.]
MQNQRGLAEPHLIWGRCAPGANDLHQILTRPPPLGVPPILNPPPNQALQSELAALAADPALSRFVEP